MVVDKWLTAWFFNISSATKLRYKFRKWQTETNSHANLELLKVFVYNNILQITFTYYCFTSSIILIKIINSTKKILIVYQKHSTADEF